MVSLLQQVLGVKPRNRRRNPNQNPEKSDFNRFVLIFDFVMMIKRYPINSHSLLRPCLSSILFLLISSFLHLFLSFVSLSCLDSSKAFYGATTWFGDLVFIAITAQRQALDHDGKINSSRPGFCLSFCNVWCLCVTVMLYVPYACR